MNRLITLALAAALAAGSTIAAQAETVTLRMAAITPDNTIWANQIKRYINKVEELSGGDLTIEFFPNAQLGTMGDTMKMALTGRLDIWVGAAPALANVTNELALLSLPYLFETTEEAACVTPLMDAYARERIGKKYQLISFLPVGSQSLGLRQKARVPADLEGVKLRTAALKTSMMFFRELGANPVPLPAAETNTSLSTGLVDGVDFAPTFYVATGANKTAPVFLPTEHNYNIGAMIMSTKSWHRLTEAQQKTLLDANEVMEFASNAQEIQAFEAEMIAAHSASGGTVVELTAQERQIWVETGQAMWPDMQKEIRGDVEGFIEKLVEAKQTCAP